MNIVKGTILKFSEAVFTGRYPKAKYSHTAEHTVEVIKESYGSLRGQHSFTLEVIESSEKQPGDRFRKMGRNLYPTAEIISQPENYQELVELKAKDKETAEYNKYHRWYMEAMFEGKPWKMDKIPKHLKHRFDEEHYM